MPKLFLKKITAKDKNEDADANFFKMTTDEEVAYLQYMLWPSRRRFLMKVAWIFGTLIQIILHLQKTASKMI